MLEGGLEDGTWMVADFFWCCSEWHADDADTKVARMVADFFGVAGRVADLYGLKNQF